MLTPICRLERTKPQSITLLMQVGMDFRTCHKYLAERKTINRKLTFKYQYFKHLTVFCKQVGPKDGKNYAEITVTNLAEKNRVLEATDSFLLPT